MKRTPIPKYRRQKEKGQDRAFVVLGGRRIHLGGYDTPESRERYARAIAEWEASGAGHVPPGEITIMELVARFWTHAESYYVKPNRETTNELELFRSALPLLNKLYGTTRACEFGPLAFRAVRQRMVDRGWSRKYVNKQASRIKRVFRWAASEELAPPAVWHALQAVPGLKRGRTTARETRPVEPAPRELVEGTLPHLTPTLRAMVELQRCTGMRPGEVCQMRMADLEMSGSPWVYRPAHHKTEHHGRDRTIYLGPRAQEALRPMLRADPEAYLFQPLRSEQERRDTMHAARKTPLSCGNKPGSVRKIHPKWGPGEKYKTCTYGKAIRYACQQAFPAPDGTKGDDLKAWRNEHCWSPNQLRHAFATDVRRRFGLESAQVLLGHAQADVTQVYAERDAERAVAVIEQVG